MENKARIAVVGAGWWSTYTHIPAIQANPDATLVALCDSQPAKLATAAQAYDIERVYTDLSTMLAQEDINGVVIATPHATHYQLARTCLEHDIHVIVEKPMTLRAADARQLVMLATAHKRELIVGYPWHYGPHALQARAIIQSGELGRIQYVVCTFSSYIIELLNGHDRSDDPGAYPVHGPGDVYSQPHLSGGGMGHLQMTHALGLLSFVSGLRAERVMALMHNHDLSLDLVDAMTIAFEGGALGVAGGTGNGIQRKLDLQIHCERGAIDMDLVAATAVIRRAHDAGEELAPLGDEQGGYPRFAPINNLVDIVLERAVNGSPAEVGWRTVEILDAAYRSASRQGSAVAIEELYA